MSGVPTTMSAMRERAGRISSTMMALMGSTVVIFFCCQPLAIASTSAGDGVRLPVA